MTTQTTLTMDVKKTALVIMDFQNDIVKIATDPASVLKNASAVLAGARKAKLPVYYIQHRGGAFEAQVPGVDIVDAVKPLPTEKVLQKTRTGSFSTTSLDVMLREKGIDTVAMIGVATSGCVISTARWAADINYKVVVVKDACGDRDEEVHRVLTEKLLARSSMTTKDFLSQIGS